MSVISSPLNVSANRLSEFHDELIGAVADRPWAVDGLLGVRPLVTVALGGDHRATDGATGSRLLKTIDRLLQAPEEL